MGCHHKMAALFCCKTKFYCIFAIPFGIQYKN